jgi:RimJ/RimL family protein N-acetyltransferase
MKFLEGEKVYLRPISVDDTETYLQLLTDPKTRKLTGTQKSFNKEQIRDYITSRNQDPSNVLLLISLQINDKVIGDIQLLEIDTINQSCYIRISIESEENQGKGYGTEALKLMLEYGFGILHLHRIELNVFSFNKRALHVYENLGFKIEGIQREALFYDHQYHDSIIMSMLAHEYREKHKPNMKS